MRDIADIPNIPDQDKRIEEITMDCYGAPEFMAGFYTYFEDAPHYPFELLTCLLKLNHERYAQECHEGLHKPKDCATFFAEHPEYQRTGKVDWDRLRKGNPTEDQPEQKELFDDDNPQKRLL
jgi:hypothetical protein